MEIAIQDIVAGERRREDLGDITGLAASIQDHGLMQPIVIDAENRLIAGERRLRACEFLGWAWIEVRQYGDLSDQELRFLELEENIRRKDLTAYEHAKNMVAYTEAAEEQLKQEADLLPESGNKSTAPTHERGRPSQTVSQEKVSERTGIPRQRATEAQSHVATADAFPFMKSWPAYRVLEAKDYVVLLPEAEHPAVIKLLTQPGIPPDSGLAIIKNLTAKTPEQRADIYQHNESKDRHERGKALTMAANLPPMPDPRLGHIQDAIASLRACVRLSKDDLKSIFSADVKLLQDRERSIRDYNNTAEGQAKSD